MRPLIAEPKIIRPYDVADDSCAAGHVVVAQTDRGTDIQVWRPVPKVAATQFGFFCHGHATLSHHLYGYSIPGDALETVLREEWTRVAKKPIKGDIVVFRNDDNSIAHTARIENAVHSRGASTIKTLSTKNGNFDALLTGQSIDQVQGTYPSANWRITGGGCRAGVVKQYYRRNNRTIDAAWSFT